MSELELNAIAIILIKDWRQRVNVVFKETTIFVVVELETALYTLRILNTVSFYYFI